MNKRRMKIISHTLPSSRWGEYTPGGYRPGKCVLTRLKRQKGGNAAPSNPTVAASEEELRNGGSVTGPQFIQGGEEGVGSAGAAAVYKSA